MTHLNRSAPAAARVGIWASFAAPKAAGISFKVLVDLIHLVDTIILLGCGVIATLSIDPLTERVFLGEFVIATLSAAAISVYLLNKAMAYKLAAIAAPAHTLARSAGAVLAGGVISCVFLWLLRHSGALSLAWSAAWVCSSAGVLALFRATLGVVVRRWLRAGRLDRKVAVIGAGELADSFIRRARNHPMSRTCVVGLYDDIATDAMTVPDSSSVVGYPMRGNIDTLLLDCRLRNVDAVVITLPTESLNRIRDICARLRPVVADIYVAPEISVLDLGPMEMDEMGATPLFPIARKPISNWDRVSKEVFDRVVAFLLLALVGPLLIVVAALIRLESPGPVLFRQTRVGFKNNPFQILKLRTMYHESNDRLAARQTGRCDPRVTPIGRVLRKLSIDELPQLFNVLRGDMSLVGPRPHAPGTSLGTRRVDEVLEDYAQRHRVKPGITGLAQVCGCRGEMVTEEQVTRRVRYDIEYIEKWSLWLDMKILFLTLRREIYSRNAY